MAATGTPTPNIGLRIPQGTDPASVADINYNSTVIDQKFGPVGNTSLQEQIDSAEEAMAYVVNGNDAPSGGIPSGKYVYVKNNTNGIATGMYITTAAISSGATVQASSLSACSEGAVNSLNSKIAKQNVSNFVTIDTTKCTLSQDNSYCTKSANTIDMQLIITPSVSSGNLGTINDNVRVLHALYAPGTNNTDDKIEGNFILHPNGNFSAYGLTVGKLYCVHFVYII